MEGSPFDGDRSEPGFPSLRLVPCPHIQKSLTLLLGQVVQQLMVAVGLRANLKSKIGAPHGALKNSDLARHLTANVFDDLRCRGGRVRCPCGLGKQLCKVLDVLEFGSEIVPPLRDAMGFVHHDRLDIPELLSGQEHGVLDAFRGHVQKGDFAKPHVVEDPVALVAHPCFCTDAHPPQHIALVLHQSDQGGDDQASPATGECRKLEAQTFAPTCGEDGQRGCAASQGHHRPHLPFSKGRETPMLLQQMLHGGVQRWGSFFLSHVVVTMVCAIFVTQTSEQKSCGTS